MINLSSFYPINIETGFLVFTTGNQNISGLKNFSTRPTVNGTGVLLYNEDGTGSIGNYHFTIEPPYLEKQYLKQIAQIQNIPSGLNLKNNDIINIGFGSPPEGTGTVRTLKVNPGILVTHEEGFNNSRNYFRFSGNHPDYSGKAIQKIRYNSTIGNGYVYIVLAPAAVSVHTAPIIRPKTRRLETFYDINVPPGGGIRYLNFRTPTSFPFVQGTCMNLRFNFAGDNTPCIINCVDPNEQLILSLTGANYNFIQKERVILISKGENGTVYEFKHW